MTPDDAERISALVRASFDEFIAPDYTEQGMAEFRRYAEAEALRRRSERDHFVMVAEVDGVLAGMIEVRAATTSRCCSLRRTFTGGGSPPGSSSAASRRLAPGGRTWSG